MALRLVVLLMLVLASCPTSSQASDNAGETCHTITVSDSLTLEQAVEQISAQDRNINCTSVELSSGTHTITSPSLFMAKLTSLRFVGLGGIVSVSCNYSAATNYTWYFEQLDSVILQNLHFESCPRPLRLDTIADVEIKGCSFRSVKWRHNSHSVIHTYCCFSIMKPFHIILTGTFMKQLWTSTTLITSSSVIQSWNTIEALV